MKDKKGNGQAATRSRWHRLGCWIWFRIIMLLLVVSLLVAYSVEVFRCGYYKPTGDALYDRYATAVISRQKWVLFHGDKHHPTYLPDSLLAEWEGEFGYDPRYWQLRYFCARHKGGFWASGQPVMMRSRFRIPTMIMTGIRPWDIEPTQIEVDAWQHLQTGVEKGAADWITLEMLWRETRQLRERAQNDEMHALDKLSLDWAELRQRKIELNRANEQAELDRHSAMIEADPSQAWPYFWRAKYWFMYGESERALEDLKAGNAAPNNETSKPFPAVFLLDRISSGNHLGSDTLAGAILEDDAYSALPNWIRWKDIYKEAEGMVALGGSTDILQELHLAACRLGKISNGSSIELSVAATLESMLSDTLLVEYGADLSYLQRKTMKSMNSRARSVHYYWQSWSDQTWPYIEKYPRLRTLGRMMNVIGGGGRCASVQPPNYKLIYPETIWQHLKPRLYYNRALWQRQQLQNGVVEIGDSFEKLEQVNLNTLEWPQKWGDPY